VTSQADLQKAKLLRAANEFALDCTKSEHAELSDAFRSLDAKAQSTVTLAGILVAAAFAFLKDWTATPSVVKVCVLLTLLLSLATIAYVLAAVRLTEIAMPLSGGSAARLARDAASGNLSAENPEAEKEELMAGFLGDVQRSWAESVDDLRAKIAEKAKRVRAAQVFAGLAVASAAAAVVFRPWS
jgi:hypothetical protein